MNKTLVIVPTYNERDNLPPLAERLLKLPLPVDLLVVDDNSPDGTGALADEQSVAFPGRLSVIHRAGKLGLGTATIAAFVGAGGYGERIVAGLAVNDNLILLAGAIPAALMAIVMQLGFDLLDRWLIPLGLRHE